MKTILVAVILLNLSFQNALNEPSNDLLKSFKQKFPSAKNIKWIEEDNRIKVTAEIMGKIEKWVQNDPNTWKVIFLLGNRKTSARFDLAGHWLDAQQEIILEELGVAEVISAIKKDFYD